jgi:hypothetical protein
MENISLIWEYVRGCMTGSSTFSDCAPLWQLGAIGGFVALAGVALWALIGKAERVLPERLPD